MGMMLIYSYVIMIANYIFMGLALYKIAKVQNKKYPWLAWIPIGNIYTMIIVSNSPLWFIIAPIVLMLVVGMTNAIARVATMILALVFIITVLYMYKKLCDEYDGSFLMLLVGLFPPIFFISIYGQWKLYKGACEIANNPNKRRISSQVRVKNKK